MMMPKPAYEVSSGQAPISDPTNIKFWKDETATAPAGVTASSSAPQSASATPTNLNPADRVDEVPVAPGTDISIDDGWKKTD
ncbi:MAG TPA: hypothetical protein PLR50_08450, partial [Candidatus Rifleibacterium sp.]|nr:hypothetical protein [Candidatus Rifleibacterium sp.]